MSRSTRILSTLALAALAGSAVAQTTTRISLYGTSQSTQHAFHADIAGNGRVAAFAMGTATSGGYKHIWVYDVASGVATDITNGLAINALVPRLSYDGQWVAYSSPNNLTSHPRNGHRKLFLENIASGAVELISVTPTGTGAGGQYAALSRDTRYVAFESNTGDLTVPGTTAGVFQIYVRDRTAGTNTLISHTLGGGGGNAASRFPDISADGRWVVFRSDATDLLGGTTPGTQIYVCDRTTGTVTLLSRNASGQPANNGSDWPSISSDGRFVTYSTAATNLVSGVVGGNFEVIVLDRDDDGNGIFDDSPAHNTSASKDSLGNRLRSIWAGYPQISGDGRWVLFRSFSTLVQNATPWLHVYLHDRTTGQTTCVSVDSNYNFGNNMSGTHCCDPGYLAIDEDGNRAVFVSEATNLVSGDTNGLHDMFLHEVPRNPTRMLRGSLAGHRSLAPSFTVWQGRSLDFHLRLRDALPNGFAVLGISSWQSPTPMFGGTVIPAFPLLALGPVFPDVNGALDVTASLTPGPSLFLQWGVLDPAAVQGVALSNALELFIQP